MAVTRQQPSGGLAAFWVIFGVPNVQFQDLDVVRFVNKAPAPFVVSFVLPERDSYMDSLAKPFPNSSLTVMTFHDVKGLTYNASVWF